MPDTELDALSAAGGTDRVFVFQRSGGSAPTFAVRPGVVFADGNQIRFRNFTAFNVRIEAGFLSTSSFSLTPKGSPGDRKTVNLSHSPSPGFHEYIVVVTGPSGEVEAVGDSRPGAIIDR